MPLKRLAPAVLLAALAATACNPQEPPVEPEGGINDPAGSPEPPAEEAAEEETGQAPSGGLSEPVDVGEGVTLTMVDLRREVAENGFNATTGEEGALPYAAWSLELTNNSPGPIEIGGQTSSCHVGDPLVEAEQPNLGASLNPPDMLAAEQTAAWDVDCWMGADESVLQYTVELYDAAMVPMYTATFSGEVP